MRHFEKLAICSGCGNSEYSDKKDNGICPGCSRPMFSPYHAKLEIPGICFDCGDTAHFAYVILRPKKTTQKGIPLCSKCIPTTDPIMPWVERTNVNAKDEEKLPYHFRSGKVA